MSLFVVAAWEADLAGFLHHPALRAGPPPAAAAPRRVVGVHHCWVCDAEVTQPYWLHPDRTVALPAVWWGHCETTWFEAPEQVRDDDRAAA